MATTTNITTTYAGEFAGKYIGAALFSADTIDKGLITVRQNVKYKEAIKKMIAADLVKDATCAFTATGTVTLTERLLEPKELQVNVELCKDDFQSDWEAIEMGYSAFDVLPANFTEFFIAKMAEYVGEATETSLWHGVNTNAGEFNGFIPLMTADGTVLDVAGAAGGVTASNVIAELQKVVDLIPTAVLKKPDLLLYVASDVARSYTTALGTLGYMNWYTAGEKPLDFGGITMVVANGMEDGYMVAAQKSNLWFGTGLLNDKNEVKILDMSDLDGSQNVRFIMRYTGDANYGIGAECVLYTPGA